MPAITAGAFLAVGASSHSLAVWLSRKDRGDTWAEREPRDVGGVWHDQSDSSPLAGCPV